MILESQLIEIVITYMEPYPSLACFKQLVTGSRPFPSFKNMGFKLAETWTLISLTENKRQDLYCLSIVIFFPATYTYYQQVL